MYHETFENRDISFQLIGKNWFINANQLCSIRGRKPSQWLQSKYASQYLRTLIPASNSDTPEKPVISQTREIDGITHGIVWVWEPVAKKMAWWLTGDESLQGWLIGQLRELRKEGIYLTESDMNIAHLVLKNGTINTYKIACYLQTPYQKLHNAIIRQKEEFGIIDTKSATFDLTYEQALKVCLLSSNIEKVSQYRLALEQVFKTNTIQFEVHEQMPALPEPDETRIIPMYPGPVTPVQMGTEFLQQVEPELSAGQLFLRNYLGTDIQFEVVNGKVMANATQMCKAFGKQTKDWLKSQQTERYIQAISARTKILPTDLVIVKNGGSDYGTWIYEKLILRLAGWLSVDFEVWCDEQIAELLSTGKVELTDPATLGLPDFTKPGIAARAWAEQFEGRELAEAQVEVQKARILKMVPKVNYADSVLNSEGLITTNTIALELGISAITLNQFLKEQHIQYKQGEHWVLASGLRDKELIGIATSIDVHGERSYSRHLMKWTEKGRMFIHRVYQEVQQTGTYLLGIILKDLAA